MRLHRNEYFPVHRPYSVTLILAWPTLSGKTSVFPLSGSIGDVMHGAEAPKMPFIARIVDESESRQNLVANIRGQTGGRFCCRTKWVWNLCRGGPLRPTA
jgi:hypothetical protein